MLDIILELAGERLLNLREALEISLKISNKLDNEGEDGVPALADEREKIIERLKNNDVSVKHYISKLPPAEKYAVELINVPYGAPLPPENTGGGEYYAKLEKLRRLKAEQFGVLDLLKETDGENSAKIAETVKALRINLNHLKKNRGIMEKYIPDDIKPGTLHINRT